MGYPAPIPAALSFGGHDRPHRQEVVVTSSIAITNAFMNPPVTHKFLKVFACAHFPAALFSELDGIFRIGEFTPPVIPSSFHRINMCALSSTDMAHRYSNYFTDSPTLADADNMRST
jgi:hypothetical protein